MTEHGKQPGAFIIRLPAFVGVAALAAGLLFAALGHYLTLVSKQAMFAEKAAREALLVRQISSNIQASVVLKKLQAIFSPENGYSVYFFSSGNAVDGFSAGKSGLSAEEIQHARELLLELSAEPIREGYRFKTTLRKNYLLVGIPEKNSQVYVLLIAPADSRTLRIIVIFYTLALLFAAILTIIGFLIARELEASILQLNSLVTMKNPQWELVSAPYREIGLLKNTIQNLLTQRDNVQTGGAMTDESQKNEEAIMYLQQTLFEKPFPRLKNYELALYPRHPSLHAENFLGAHEEPGFLDIFCGHFDLNNLEANLWKHRLQEKFYTVSASRAEAAKAVSALWQALFSRVDIGPGMLYLRLENSELKIFRAGPFHVFALLHDHWESLAHGETFFSSNFASEDLIPVSLPEALLIVSQDVLDILESDPESFVENLRNTKDNSAKGIVAAIAEKLYERWQNNLASELAGFVLAVKRKN